jgi:exodeoxyribonuclease VIII
MEIGTAIHTALLEPDRFAADYVLLREVKDRRASEYKQAVKTHGTEVVLTSGEADNVIGMQEAVLSNELMRSRLTGEGWRELSLFVRDPDTDVLVRVRYDLLLTDGTIVDVKKTQDARLDPFSRAIDNYGYDLSAALYVDAFEWATGEQAQFEFAAVEETMPHGHKLYRPCDTTLNEGRRKYREALESFANCEYIGVWPSLPCEAPEIISLPAYRLAQIENALEDGGIY